MIARADGKCSRHKGWWGEGKDELATPRRQKYGLALKVRYQRLPGRPYRKPWKLKARKIPPHLDLKILR